MTVGGDSEMTACAMTETPRGIISTSILGVVFLNQDADGQAIALVGRTPKSYGTVEKGDKLLCWCKRNGLQRLTKVTWLVLL